MISPLDERYVGTIRDLADLFNEFCLNKYRVQVEIAWLLALQEEVAFELTKTSRQRLEDLRNNFTLEHFNQIKALEKETRHDVKAVEYFLKNYLQETDPDCIEWVHFGLTSEDINNLSYASLLREGRQLLLLELDKICDFLKQWSLLYAGTAMLGRTHGQVASPTTFGKEIANFLVRIKKGKKRLAEITFFGKINGAVGNFNGLFFCFPEVNWLGLAERVVEGFGLVFQKYTTQIEPHDWMAELSNTITQVNVILLDLVRDLWGYGALGYLSNLVKKREIGSSTMPHKVNPIDFENSEGNLGIANALLQHFALKLPVSRWQRDLSDSTVIRNWGVALGHSLLAYRTLLTGFSRIAVNEKVMYKELDQHWEILAEPIQLMLRKKGVPKGYELLKQLTRGKKLTRGNVRKIIEQLPLEQEDKVKLFALTPLSYLGLAQELVQMV